MVNQNNRFSPEKKKRFHFFGPLLVLLQQLGWDAENG